MRIPRLGVLDGTERDPLSAGFKTGLVLVTGIRPLLNFNHFRGFQHLESMPACR